MCLLLLANVTCMFCTMTHLYKIRSRTKRKSYAARLSLSRQQTPSAQAKPPYSAQTTTCSFQLPQLHIYVQLHFVASSAPGLANMPSRYSTPPRQQRRRLLRELPLARATATASKTSVAVLALPAAP